MAGLVGGMTTTAVRLSDQAVCAELLAELGRLRTSSGARLPETADGADVELRRDGEPWRVRHHSYSATSAISI